MCKPCPADKHSDQWNRNGSKIWIIPRRKKLLCIGYCDVLPIPLVCCGFLGEILRIRVKKQMFFSASFSASLAACQKVQNQKTSFFFMVEKALPPSPSRNYVLGTKIMSQEKILNFDQWKTCHPKQPVQGVIEIKPKIRLNFKIIELYS